MRAGSHRLRITLPDGGRVLDRVDVTAGRTHTYRRSFSRGSLSVVLQPFGSGGEVHAGGRMLGKLPGPPMELYEGVHRVEIRREDGWSTVQRVEIEPGREASLSVEAD